MTRLYKSYGQVHAETDLVKEIVSSPIKNAVTLALIIGCSVSYVRQIRAFKRLRSHVFLHPETARQLRGLK